MTLQPIGPPHTGRGSSRSPQAEKSIRYRWSWAPYHEASGLPSLRSRSTDSSARAMASSRWFRSAKAMAWFQRTLRLLLPVAQRRGSSPAPVQAGHGPGRIAQVGVGHAQSLEDELLGVSGRPARGPARKRIAPAPFRAPRACPMASSAYPMLFRASTSRAGLRARALAPRPSRGGRRPSSGLPRSWRRCPGRSARRPPRSGRRSGGRLPAVARPARPDSPAPRFLARPAGAACRVDLGPAAPAGHPATRKSSVAEPLEAAEFRASGARTVFAQGGRFVLRPGQSTRSVFRSPQRSAGCPLGSIQDSSPPAPVASAPACRGSRRRSLPDPDRGRGVAQIPCSTLISPRGTSRCVPSTGTLRLVRPAARGRPGCPLGPDPKGCPR